MPEPRAPAKIWLVTALMTGVIVYGSLYPFGFRTPVIDSGPVAALLHSIGRLPGRGDALANVLLYMPFGFFFVLACRRSPSLVFACVAGGLLSLAVELAQHYVAGRVTTFTDVVTNTLGALLGGLLAVAIGARIRLPFLGDISTRPVPSLLLLAWLGYRLYPYVPTIDLHKYWNALKPIVLTPSLTGSELCRQVAVWLVLYALIEAIVRRRHSVFLAPLFALAVFGAKVFIVSLSLRLAEPVGAGVAFIVWFMLLHCPARVQAGVAGLVLTVHVVLLRLEPFTFLPEPRDFGWIPFLGLMRGSVEADTLAFLEKFFLYGSMVYLLGRALGRVLPAVALTVAVLLATSWAQTWLPGRSGEITDPAIALLASVVFALLPSGREQRQAATGHKPTGRERRLRDWQQAQARALGIEPDR